MDLRENNAEFERVASELRGEGSLVKRIVGELLASSQEEKDIEDELANVNKDTEGQVTEQNEELLKNMQDSWDAMKEMDTASGTAVAAAEAAEAAVAEVDKDLQADL